MRILIATLAFATAAAFAADLSFDQARELANKDSAALNVDQVLALAQSQNKASSLAMAKCPKPSRHDEFAPFTVVMEIDASGKITRTWLQGTTAVATCFNQEMGHQTLLKPAHAPFYATYSMAWQQ